MTTRLDAYNFSNLLQNEKFDEAKQFISTLPKAPKWAGEIYYYVKYYGPNDDSIFQHCISHGLVFDLDENSLQDSLYVIASSNKYNLIRPIIKLFDQEIVKKVLSGLDMNALEIPFMKTECAVTLIELGAQLKPNTSKIEWKAFYDRRQLRRREALAILTLDKAKSSVIGSNRKDVLSLIAKYIWSSRFTIPKADPT